MLLKAAEKPFTDEVWFQVFLVPLPNGSAWESRLNICLVLWAQMSLWVTNETSETAGQRH